MGDGAQGRAAAARGRGLGVGRRRRGGGDEPALASRLTIVTAVDADRELLGVFGDRAERLGVAARLVYGRWLDVAGGVDPADVVLCGHVLYNVADLRPFVGALTR